MRICLGYGVWSHNSSQRSCCCMLAAAAYSCVSMLYAGACGHGERGGTLLPGMRVAVLPCGVVLHACCCWVRHAGSMLLQRWLRIPSGWQMCGKWMAGEALIGDAKPQWQPRGGGWATTWGSCERGGLAAERSWSVEQCSSGRGRVRHEGAISARA